MLQSFTSSPLVALGRFMIWPITPPFNVFYSTNSCGIPKSMPEKAFRQRVTVDAQSAVDADVSTTTACRE